MPFRKCYNEFCDLENLQLTKHVSTFMHIVIDINLKDQIVLLVCFRPNSVVFPLSIDMLFLYISMIHLKLTIFANELHIKCMKMKNVWFTSFFFFLLAQLN